MKAGDIVQSTPRAIETSENDHSTHSLNGQLPDAECRSPSAFQGRGVVEWFRDEGRPLPPGQSWLDDELAYNFVLCSENAEAVTLLLYSEEDPARPILAKRLDPQVNKLRTIWFCKVPKADVPGARYYAYSIDGPSPGGPDVRHAFDPEKILL
ncbi:early set domain-containing protein, partial [Singulisphaera rosea]